MHLLCHQSTGTDWELAFLRLMGLFSLAGPKAGDYTYREGLEHKCKRDILLGRLKNSEDKTWKRIRPRPTKTNFVGSYYLCKGDLWRLVAEKGLCQGRLGGKFWWILPACCRVSCPISSLWTGCLSTVKGNELLCCGEQAASKVVEQKSSKGSVRCCTQSSAQSCSTDMGFTENLPPVHVLTLVPLNPTAPWQGCGSA